jgi:ABC-2 type transport system ATP-binding protein
VLALETLHKRYGDVVALDGASLKAHRGRILGFLGPNGAGKTTAMRSVFGLVALDRGTMSWDDKRIVPTDRLRFGYMPEQRGLYPKMKAAEQIAWLGQLRGMSAADAIAGARRWLGRLGLEDRMDDRIEQLSHGNQQRAQLAASLVHDPELLVLDEPFSGLDPMGADAMADILRDRAQAGAAVLFSSHQLDVVEDLCEDVAVIANGRIVLDGTLDDVRSSAPTRRLEVAFADPATTWEPPVASEPTRNGRGVQAWLVPTGSDPSALLDSANGRDRVTHFVFTPPALSEIFREAVQ